MPETISRSTEIDADADRVWALISDLPGMGRLSPENTGGHWLGGATGPAEGARFRGANRQGKRRWTTVAKVTDCQPGRRFAFAVTSVGLPVATWAYDVEPRAEGGCRVTESWTDDRGRLITVLGGVTTGVSDRASYAATSMEQTLAQLKTHAEATA